MLYFFKTKFVSVSQLMFIKNITLFNLNHHYIMLLKNLLNLYGDFLDPK